MRTLAGTAAVMTSLWLLIAQVGDSVALRYVVAAPLLIAGVLVVVSEFRRSRPGDS